jgi:ribulokinase
MVDNNKDLFLGVDFGTQGVRVGVVNMKGKIVSTHEIKYPIAHPKPGYATQDPSNWWDGFERALDMALLNIPSGHSRKDIKGLSLDTTSATVVPVDEDGEALDEAILWMDIRATKQADRINATKHRVLDYCGGAVSPEWAIPKVLWLKEEKPEIYEKSYKIVEQQDYFNHKLTGNWVVSQVNAVCKWNYIAGEGYDEDYLNQVGLEDYEEKIVTDVVPMGEHIGNLTDELAQRFELDAIPIYQGGIDAHIGMVGMGVTKPGTMAASMGTSIVQLLLTDSKDQVDGIWGPYHEAMFEGLTLLEAGQVSAGSVQSWFTKQFEKGDSNAFQTLQNEIKEIPIGSDGVRALDFFQGNRTPYRDAYATGNIDGLTLQHTPAHIYRALLESVAFGFRNINDNFEKHGVPVDRVVATGGITKNKEWMQIIADVTGKEFIINENIEAGQPLGCAIIVAVSCGSYDSYEEAVENMVHEKETVYPNLENTEKYEEAYQDYLNLYKKLKQDPQEITL